MVLKGFSKQDLISLLELIRECAECQTREEFASILAQILQMGKAKIHISQNTAEPLIDHKEKTNGLKLIKEASSSFDESNKADLSESFPGALNNSANEHLIAFVDIFTPHLQLAQQRVFTQPAKPLPALSEREKEVLAWIKEGKTNWEISVILKISQNTVKFHVRNILRKLSVSNKQHAIAIAIENNLIL